MTNNSPDVKHGLYGTSICEHVVEIWKNILEKEQFEHKKSSLTQDSRVLLLSYVNPVTGIVALQDIINYLHSNALYDIEMQRLVFKEFFAVGQEKESEKNKEYGAIFTFVFNDPIITCENDLTTVSGRVYSGRDAFYDVRRDILSRK